MSDELPTTPTPAGTGRLPSGKFAPGNRCAKGNPHHRRMAQLRAAALEEVTETDIRTTFRDMLNAVATKGDVAAARVVLDYTLGRPTQPLEISGPDGEPLPGLSFETLVVTILATLADFPAARDALGPKLWALAPPQAEGAKGD